MKNLKRVLSAMLAVIMITALFAMPCDSFASTEDPFTPQDPTGYSYDEMISYFQQHMKMREEKITCTFYTYDLSFVDLASATAPRYGVALYDNIMMDVFTKCYSTSPDPQLGDYLYNSISHITPLQGSYTEYVDLAGTTFFKFTISFKFSYYSSYAQEESVSAFIAVFNRKYMSDNLTDYEKVKTIYDFVVRNTTYDHEVFDGEYGPETERYRISHSAYGAVYGNLLDKDGGADSYNNGCKITLTGEKIVSVADQGLAVCEGYSKLFYALCVSQGIECRIVDGDYVEESGKAHDPHEWNYVKLDDGVKPDGARWYQVDTTFASQKSMKRIDMQCYDYFLRGYNNVSFGYNHQMAYDNYGFGAGEKEQLYDWYTDENISSAEDYEFPPVTFNVQEEVEKGYILRRTTVYEGSDEEKASYIFTDLDQSFFVAIDENGDPLLEEVEGFGFTGVESRFDVLIPYLIPQSEYYVQAARATAASDNYFIKVMSESDPDGLNIPFKIVPRDMSNNSGNYSVTEIQTNEPYSGSIIQPVITLVDGYNNRLYNGHDYDVYYYTDETKQTTATLKNIGTYWCDIVFKGNYCGEYFFSFQIGKADLSRLSHPDMSFKYYPKVVRENNNLFSVTDVYKRGAGNLNIDGLALTTDVDYTVSYAPNNNSNLEWGASGKITLTGTQASEKLLGGSSTTFNYVINQKYDISSFDGKLIDNEVYYYTGSAIYPKTHKGISDVLEEGVDYKIVSYTNNVDVGDATVTIQGINGCTGTVKMHYKIVPLSVADANIKDVSFISNNTISYKFYYGTRLLTKNVDYTEKLVPTSTGYQLTLTGKGNYNSTYIVNITINKTSNTTNTGTTTTTTTTTRTTKNPVVKKTKVTKLKSSKKAIAVTWKAVGGNVTGYRVEYSTSKNFTKKTTKYKYVKGKKKTSYTIKSLKRKTRYYVRVRTYYTKGKYTYIAPKSNVKYIKTK